MVWCPCKLEASGLEEVYWGSSVRDILNIHTEIFSVSQLTRRDIEEQLPHNKNPYIVTRFVVTALYRYSAPE